MGGSHVEMAPMAEDPDAGGAYRRTLPPTRESASADCTKSAGSMNGEWSSLFSIYTCCTHTDHRLLGQSVTGDESPFLPSNGLKLLPD